MKLRLELFALGTLAVTVPFAVLVACSANKMPPVLLDPETSTTSTAKDGNVVDTGPACVDAGSGEAGCVPLALCGSSIIGDYVPSTIPAPLGGTLVDGTYRLSQFHEYTGPAGSSGPSGIKAKITVELTATEIKFTSFYEGSVPTTQKYSYIMITPESGMPTTLDLTLVCDTGMMSVTRSTIDYTILNDTFTLQGSKIANVYIKQ
jgi:hypothetical protein